MSKRFLRSNYKDGKGEEKEEKEERMKKREEKKRGGGLEEGGNGWNVKLRGNIIVSSQLTQTDALPTPQRTQMWAQVGNSGRRRSRGTLPSS